MNNKITLVFGEIYEGNEFKGTELAPKKIYKEMLKPINKHINYKELNYRYSGNNKTKNNIKNYDNLLINLTKLRNNINNVFKAGNFPLILGGDHSIAFSTVSSFINNFENGSVVWIDAHSDINTPLTSKSMNAHGMPLSSAIGIGDSGFNNFFNEYVKPENIYLMGTRDVESNETEIIKKYRINNYSMEDVEKRGLQDIINEVIENMVKNKSKDIHLSIDVDSLDPIFIKGTGTPVEKGFEVKDIHYITSRFIETRLVRSIDIVEFNPLLDSSNVSFETVKKIVSSIYKDLVNNVL